MRMRSQMDMRSMLSKAALKSTLCPVMFIAFLDNLSKGKYLVNG